MKTNKLANGLVIALGAALVLIFFLNLKISHHKEVAAVPAGQIQANAVQTNELLTSNALAGHELAYEKSTHMVSREGANFKIIVDPLAGSYATVTSNNLVTLKNQNNDIIWSTNITRLIRSGHIDNVSISRGNIWIVPSIRPDTVGSWRFI